MDIEKLIEQLNGYFDGKTLTRGAALDAATALSTLQAENEKLRAEVEHWRNAHHQAALNFQQENRECNKVLAELEQVKQDRDAAVDCIYQIEDDLDRGNDNDWAREHIAEWESQKED